MAFPSADNVVAVPGKPISIPSLAVIRPIASTLVTSSYVSVPPIVTLPSTRISPLTSRSALISTVSPNVDRPTTFKVSSMLVTSRLVTPSTSRSPLASILLLKVEIPVTKISPLKDASTPVILVTSIDGEPVRFSATVEIPATSA